MAKNFENTPFTEWYRKFLERRKENLRGRYFAAAMARLDATQKSEELAKEMQDIDEQLAKCAEVARERENNQGLKIGNSSAPSILVAENKNKNKGIRIDGSSASPIQVDSDSESDGSPVIKKRFVGFKGESSKSRGQCSKGDEVLGFGVEGGEADMEISDGEPVVKEVISSTIVVQGEGVQEQPLIGEVNVGVAQQEQQQPLVNQERGSEEEEESEEEEDGLEAEYDSWYDGESEEDTGYPYLYHSPEVSGDDSGAYGFDSD